MKLSSNFKIWPGYSLPLGGPAQCLLLGNEYQALVGPECKHSRKSNRVILNKSREITASDVFHAADLGISPGDARIIHIMALWAAYKAHGWTEKKLEKVAEKMEKDLEYIRISRSNKDRFAPKGGYKLVQDEKARKAEFEG